MTEIKAADGGADRSRATLLRTLILVGVGVQVLIWLYLFVFIAQHANPKGDGMEWVAVVPATLVLAVGAVPALVLLVNRRWLALGVLFAAVGIILNAGFFIEIAREFAESAAR